MSDLAPVQAYAPPLKRRLHTWQYILIAFAVLSGLVLAAFVVLSLALGLAWSGAFRGDDSDSRHKPLAILSQGPDASVTTSVAATDDPGIWACGSSGFGTAAGVYVRQGDGWNWAGELNDAEALFEVRAPYRREYAPPSNRMFAIRDGADQLVYVPARGAFVWAGAVSGRMISSAPREAHYSTGTELHPHGGGKVLYHFEMSPASLAVSPDGRWIAVGMETYPRYPEEARGIKTPSPPHGPLLLLSWGPDGCEIVHDLTGHSFSVNACCFTSDGRFLLSGGNDSMVRVWSVADGKLVHEWRAEAPVVHLSATADAKHVVYCSERGHVVVTTQTGEVIVSHTTRVVDPPSGNTRSFIVTCAALSPDGKWLALGMDNAVHIVRPDSTTVLASREFDRGGPHQLSWSPSGKYLGVVANDQAYLLNAAIKD